MGSGSYTSSDWNKLKASRAIKSDSNEREIFKNRNLLEKFDPKYIGVRESRDSDEHPHSTPIAIGLDVTGSMGYLGCALVAQSIRDAMNRSNTSSIDQIISQYQYFGSTSNEPNSDVKSAVSYIFDNNGAAVQHRVICFYIGYSSWHETQTFITQVGGVRFFDLNA